MDFRRKTGSAPRGNNGRGGGGGSRRGQRGGSNNGFRASSSSSTEYYNSQYEPTASPSRAHSSGGTMLRKNRWDDHANEHDERLYIAKGLLPPREGAGPSSEYVHEPPPYITEEEFEARHRNRDNNGHRIRTHNNDDVEEDYGRSVDEYGSYEQQQQHLYDGGRGGREDDLPYEPVPLNNQYDFDQMTPPRSYQAQYDVHRDDEYRGQQQQQPSIVERETCHSIEGEYFGWNSAELNREATRLQRRLDVVREMRNRAEDAESHSYQQQQYPPPHDQEEFMQNVRGGESFYDKDETGYSPLGRQAYDTQQKRNTKTRGYIPAAGFNRYGSSDVRSSTQRDERGQRWEGGGGRDDDQRGERRDNHSDHRSNGSQSYYSGQSEAESRESLKGRKKRNKKHRGGSAHHSTLDWDEFSNESFGQTRREEVSSGYNTGGSSSSQRLHTATIQEHAAYSIPAADQLTRTAYDLERHPAFAPQPHSAPSATPSAGFITVPMSAFAPVVPRGGGVTTSPHHDDLLTPARIAEEAARRKDEEEEEKERQQEEMTRDSGRGKGGSGGYGRGGGGGDRGRGGYRSNRGGGGGIGGYGGGRVGDVSTGMRNLSLGEEPAPLPFSPPKCGEQEGYKAAAKPAPAIRQGKKIVNVITNVWPLEYDDRLVYCYDVSVGLGIPGNDGSTRVHSVNKGPKDDASVHERNELIKEALKKGLEMYRILSETGCIASDGAAMVFANESLDAALKPHRNELLVPVEALSDEVRKFIRNSGVKNVVIQVGIPKSFNIKDLSGQTSIDRSETDQTVKQFFEVITSEHALSSHKYSFFTGGNLYRDDPDRITMGGNKFARDIGFGQERRDGMSKGFTLAAKDGGIIGALNIDVTTGTFWSEAKLWETICAINGWNSPRDARWDARAIKKTNDMIKNLRVSYTPEDGNSSFDFIVHGITASTWTTTNGVIDTEVKTIENLKYMDEDGNEEPLYNKFAHRTINLHSWPLIESRRARRRLDDPTKYDVTTEHFPVELLDVKANQRVPLKKQGADPERAMPVEDRWRGTNQALEALNLFGDVGPRRTRNEVMEAFGIRVSLNPLETKGITRRMPGVTFNRDAAIDDKTSFRTGQLAYKTPAHFTLLIIAFSDNHHRFDQQSFTRALITAATRKGMRIDEHVVEIVNPNQMHDKLMSIAGEKKKGAAKYRNVLFLYVEPEASKHHDELKLFERRHLVITQHLTMENAFKMVTSKPTMENVLLKLNVKGGGHNYIVQPEKFALDLWMDKKTMIMGYDVWHPTGQSRAEKMADRLPEPSVVGFSFNGGVNPDSFIGDYHYQQATKERVHDDVLNVRLKWMLLAFEKNRGVLPPLIIVVRDGISDGQYRHGMDELEALREAAREYAVSEERLNKIKKPAVADYSPKFIFVIATKRHHKRMYTEHARGHANMPAMTAVDDTITNPGLYEFFLQSHTPLQGMAKATKYTVLKDDVGTNMDAMQALMGALCFEHQVSTNAISIPEPVYQSDEWAKRGAANMRKFKEVYGEHGQFKTGFTYEKLTERLSYWKCELGMLRVNA